MSLVCAPAKMIIQDTTKYYIFKYRMKSSNYISNNVCVHFWINFHLNATSLNINSNSFTKWESIAFCGVPHVQCPDKLEWECSCFNFNTSH